MLSQWNCFLGSSAWGSNLPSSHGRSWLTVCGLSPYLRDPAVPWRLKTYSSRKQLAFYQERKIKPRRFDDITRFMLVLLSHGFAWAECVGKRDTEDLHRLASCGVSPVWRWKSRSGQSPIPIELRRLIREMALSNLSWGEERIANELLLKLGICVSPRTVRKLWFPKTHITHYHAANRS